MFGGSGISLADIAAVIGGNRGGNSNGNDMFGNNGGIWVLIILFALFGGWGNRGNNDGGSNGGSRGDSNVTVVPVPGMGYSCPGGYGGGSSNMTYDIEAVVQRGFDQQSVINKLNGLENGMCNLGYDQLAQMNNLGQMIMQGGNNTNMAIQQATYQLRDAAQANEIANMQRSFSLQQQIADCCCKDRADTAQLRYDMSQNTCDITQAIKDAAQQIVQNDNANYRQLHDEQINLLLQQKDARIAEQAQQLNQCFMTNLVNASSASTIAALQPAAPKPAFLVQAPGTPVQIPVQLTQSNGCCNNQQFTGQATFG